jgi:hypothetical protein
MEGILYISIFLPFIGTKTPIIKRSELEKAQFENRFSILTREDLASVIAILTQKPQSSSPQKAYSTQSSSRKLPHLMDNYTKLMTSAMKPSYPKTIPELPTRRRPLNKKSKLNTSLPSSLPTPRRKIQGGSIARNRNVSHVSVNKSMRIETDSLRNIFTQSETPRRMRSGTQRDLQFPTKRQPLPNASRASRASRAARTPSVRDTKLLYLSPNLQTKQLRGSVILKPNFYNPNRKERHIMLELSTSRTGKGLTTPYNLESSFIENSSLHGTFTE